MAGRGEEALHALRLAEEAYHRAARFDELRGGVSAEQRRELALERRGLAWHSIA